MSWFYRHIVRPFLFEQDSEAIHERTLRMLEVVSRNTLLCEAAASFFEPPDMPVERFGLRFPNPLGLAAGMDKFGIAVPAWRALGFGFSELGGITWHAQAGNSIPRIFRAVADEALVNRMGFNNPGAQAMAQALSEWRRQGRWPAHPVGINLGKSKATPLEEAAEDYANSLRILWPHADFFVINVSSPNTPNLRRLQDKGALDEILDTVQQINCDLGRAAAGLREGAPTGPFALAGKSKPILVKVAPDLSLEALDDILDLMGPRQVAGIVATNTTIERPPTNHPDVQRAYAELGGLSGRPLQGRSTEVVRHLHRSTKGTVPIIGVGGIFNAADAWEKITAGASLLQVYTGMVYEGPGIARNIVTGLNEKLAETQLESIEEAVGIGSSP